MAVGQGNKSFITIGIETAFADGTSRPPTGAGSYKLEIISGNLDPNIGTIPSRSLYSGVARRGFYQGGLGYAGRFLIEGRYQGIGRLLYSAYGSVATTGPVSSVYTHTYKEAPNPPSLVIELSEGDMPAGRVKRIIGAYVTDFVLRGVAGQGDDALLTCEFGILAKDVQLDQTPTSVSAFAPLVPWLFHESTSATLDGSTETQANQVMHELTMTLANKYEERYKFGSLSPAQPIRNDYIDANWQITSDFIGILAAQNARSFATVAPKLVLAHVNDSVEFRSQGCKPREYGNPVEGYGPLLMNMTFDAFNDTTGDNSSMVCVLKNLDTAAINHL